MHVHRNLHVVALVSVSHVVMVIQIYNSCQDTYLVEVMNATVMFVVLGIKILKLVANKKCKYTYSCIW